MKYLFVSHESAIAILRVVSTGFSPVEFGRNGESERTDKSQPWMASVGKSEKIPSGRCDWRVVPRWPKKARGLPTDGSCVHTQRELKAALEQLDFQEFGIRPQSLDLLVPSKSCYSRGGLGKFHVWKRPFPVGSFLRLAKGLLVSGPELALAELCSSQTKLEPVLDQYIASWRADAELRDAMGVQAAVHPELPLVWERERRIVTACMVACEFAGTYRIAGEKGVVYGVTPMLRLEGIKAWAEGYEVTSVETRLLEVANLSFENSGSPMETALVLMLTLPVAYGGFGLPRPELNAPLRLPLNLYLNRDSAIEGDVSPLSYATDCEGIRVGGEPNWLGRSDRIGKLDSFSPSGWRVGLIIPDMLWREQGVALEYDSWEYHGQLGKTRLANDAKRANCLTALGYRVFRVTSGVVSSLADMTSLAEEIAAALGVELAEPSEYESIHRENLYMLLMPKRYG